jgi:hypothetical protein
MKALLLILALALPGCKSTPSPPPIPARHVTKSLAVSVDAPTLSIPPPNPPLVFAAYWPTPIEPGWVPEWSTNMVDWNASTQTVVWTSGYGVPWTGNFFVRLRKLP